MQKIAFLLATCCLTSIMVIGKTDQPPNISQRVETIHKGLENKPERRDTFRSGNAWVPTNPIHGGRYDGENTITMLESHTKRPKTALPCGKITGDERLISPKSTQQEFDRFNPKPITGLGRSQLLGKSKPLAEKPTGQHIAPQRRELTDDITGSQNRQRFFGNPIKPWQNFLKERKERDAKLQNVPSRHY